ncbi:MAG TPA: 2-aminoethylphosphonate--pyruvate transaminase [Terriglobia bacterium]|nr:2-aminoethylphosphonate--pyruvate transaminase [Terriglobia bacterium]
MGESVDKVLFTPGPLTTSTTVKQAMLRDLGSRDFEFLAVVRDIRRRLLSLAAVSSPDYEAIPMQGSGTFALESVIGSVIPPAGKILIAVNGAYGRRLAQTASALKVTNAVIEWDERQPADPMEIERLLGSDPSFTHAAVVHCETSTGMINPVREIGEVVREHGRRYIVDAMSSFGGIPLHMSECGVDYLVSSANKCLEGVPGFALVLARREALLATAGWARSLSLDLLAQWKGLESSGQFRFTPPTHALLAFHQALKELEEEGGVERRAARYRANCEILLQGMRELGFEEFLRPELQGYIITAFCYPRHPLFNFETFYERLSEKGYVIYPGKASKADCFRIGSIGHIFPDDIRRLLIAVRQSLNEMGIELFS